MDSLDLKFADHATRDPLWEVDRKKSKILISNMELLRQHGNRLICPNCESGAFRHGTKDRARCNCGWEGRSVTVDEYLMEKLHRR